MIATQTQHETAMAVLFSMPELVATCKSLARRDADSEYNAQKQAEFIAELTKE